MDTQKVVFLNKSLNTRMAGLLYIPDNFNLSENYPAVVVTGPIHVIPEASHFDMYDLAPFVSEAFEYLLPFFGKAL